MSLTEEKTALRTVMRDLLSVMEPAEAEGRSQLACGQLAGLPEFKAADIVLAFLSMGGEIQTESLIRKALGDGKTVAVPRMERSSDAGRYLVFVPLPDDYTRWPRDRFGIPEPPAGARALSAAELGRAFSLVVTPGLAFDRAGNRLGRGRGYFDGFLRAAREGAIRHGGSILACGFCYSAQIVGKVPAGEFDAAVDMVVTEDGRLGR